MDEVIWVEILSRHGEVLARHRCSGPEVRIGRGYSNDVVIDDPHVAALHLRVARDERGLLVAESLVGADRLFAGAERAAFERIFLDGDQPIRIGQTHLRIRDAHFVVAADRPLGSSAPLWPLALALGIALLGVTMLSLWLTETAEAKLYRYLLQLLLIVVYVSGWTAAWATVSRIFSGKARFERNLVIALAGLLAYSLFGELVTIGSYALSSSALTSFQYVGMWLILAVVCFCHLREMGPSRLELKGGIVSAVMLVAIAMQTLSRSEMSVYTGQQDVVRRLMPPALRLTPLQSESGFFADVEQLKSQLDHARAEEPPAAPAGDEQSDD
jgi:hypothetical protein